MFNRILNTILIWNLGRLRLWIQGKMFGIYIITDNISYLRANLEADSLNHHQDGKVLQQNLYSKVFLKKTGLGVLENSLVNISGMFYLKKLSNLTMMQSIMNIFLEIFKNFKKNCSFDKMYTTSTNRIYKPRKGYFAAFFEYIAITKSVAILWNRNILKYMTHDTEIHSEHCQISKTKL